MSKRNKMDNAPQARNGRDGNGQFARGNAGGPGNPFARRVALLHRAALAAVRPEDLYEIFQTLVIHAKAGRIPAIKLVLAYTLGKPRQEPNPDDVAQQSGSEQAAEQAQADRQPEAPRDKAERGGEQTQDRRQARHSDAGAGAGGGQEPAREELLARYRAMLRLYQQGN